MRTDYMPTREADLVTFLNQLSTNMTALGAAIGLETSQTSQLATLVATWNSDYAAANNETTRNKASIIAKNQAKSAVVSYARELVGIVQKYPEPLMNSGRS